MKVSDNLKIVELQAENFKRIKAVKIAPRQVGVVEIAGDNENGKSSVIDTISAALGGKDLCPEVPIRLGEEKAFVRLDLGDLIVTRRWWFKGEGDEKALTTDLRVETKEGARFDKAQETVSLLLGKIAFDPLEFSRWKPEEQYRAARAFVPDFDFDRMEGLNKKDFEDRKDVNRDVARLKAQAAGIKVPETVPPVVDVAALEAKLSEAAGINSDIATRKGQREAAAARITGLLDAANEKRREAARLIGEAETTEADAKALQTRLDEAPPLPEPVDVAQVQADLARGREINLRASLARQRDELLTAAAEKEAASKALTEAMEARKAEAEKAVAAAKMPVPGLGFGEGSLLLDGLPFAQASKARKLRTSMAIAAAMNSRLRVLRVEEGAFLDHEARGIVEEFARSHDYQIWLEVVGDGGPGAFVIEDGGVKGAAAPAQDEEEEAV